MLQQLLLMKKFSILLLYCLYSSKAGWIDPDTPDIAFETVSHYNGESYKLVFSDEFNVDNRFFHDGYDPKWTALHKNDYTNYALQYYNSNLVKTSNGFLNISTIVEDVSFDFENKDVKSRMTKNYQSGMLQGWNKFCFTGGIIEFSAILPGKSDIGGLWPAIWLLGNLARATYVGSSNNVWPWSYNICNEKLRRQQLISACNSVNHFDLESNQGRGAPEIDILETMAGKGKLINTPIHRPYFSTSLQIAPGNQNYRPNPTEEPMYELWYHHGLEYGENTSLNIFFYGMYLEGSTKDKSYLADAISANRNLYDTHFEHLHLYRLEWVPGSEGHLIWYLDDEFVFRISASALNLTSAILPEEPMYIILNTAMSSTWGFPQPCPEGCPCNCFDCRLQECLCAVPESMCQNFPANFLIDSIRVYQNPNDKNQTVGCSTPTHKSRRFIQAHKNLYMDEGDKEPLRKIAHGGGKCTRNENCGLYGRCSRHECICLNSTHTGPHCLAANGFDDIVWDSDNVITLYGFSISNTLVLLVIALIFGFIGIVGSQYYFKHLKRLKSMKINALVTENDYRYLGSKEEVQSLL